MTSAVRAVSTSDGLWRRLLVTWAKTAGWLVLLGAIYFVRVRYRSTDEAFFLTQDLPVLALGGLLILALRWVPAAPAMLRPAAWMSPRIVVLAMAALCVLIGTVCARPVFEGYHLSLDEFMADFDARIFAQGQVMAPTPLQWRPFIPALQPIFGLPVPGHAYWASAYLPLNAAVRGLAMRFGVQALVNPLWSGLAVVAVWGVARRLWPDRPWLAVAAAALLASSSQLLITAMTAYAMPAHLALNLVWLWLFLRGGRLGHAGALVVGFVACGLHQVAFHPLFVAPFVLQLWLDRRWSAAALYTAAYGAICLFWVLYWSLLLKAVGVAPQSAGAVGAGWFAARVGDLLKHVNPGALGIMAESLVRFVTWQNPLAAPLALLGVGGAMRAKGVMRCLVLGVVLTLVVMTLLVPSQTHGWGYRYLHGLMGSVCLLAVWSWARLTEGLPAAAKDRASVAFVAACAVSAAVLLPLRAWQAHGYAHPYVLADAAIRRAPAQVVIVDDDAPWFDEGAVVRNDPDLRNNPKVMYLAALDEAGLRAVCARYSVLNFDGRQAARFGMETIPLPASPRMAKLRAVQAALRCDRRMG
ncbi:MAG: hypothetical protein ACHP84_00500 [Caulobacterales bacterium]